MRKLFTIILLLAATFAASVGVCDNRLVFILCDPKTPVNVRISPDNRATVVGRLDFGDYAESDGKQKNGFVHVFAGDAGDGWIHSGYVVEDPPERVNARGSVTANGRVMSRNRIDGKRKQWLEVGDEVRVYALSEEWAVTSKGYIKTQYLEVWYE